MRFFFPDSQDQIDPSFDFETEERSPFRVRQRDDLYAHEVCTAARTTDARLEGDRRRHRRRCRHATPSRSAIASTATACASSSASTRRRPRLETLGDCGAFTYVARGRAAVHRRRGHRLLRRLRLRRRHLGRPRDPRLSTHADRSATTAAARSGRRARSSRSNCAARVPSPPRRASAAVRAARRRPGLEPRLLRRRRRGAAAHRLPADRAGRHGSAEDRTRSSRACERSTTSASPDTELHLLGVTRSNTSTTFAALRRHELRQHLAVPPGVQGRPRQLLRPRRALRRAARPAGRRQPEAQAPILRRRARPSARRSQLERDCLDAAARATTQARRSLDDVLDALDEYERLARRRVATATGSTARLSTAAPVASTVRCGICARRRHPRRRSSAAPSATSAAASTTSHVFSQRLARNSDAKRHRAADAA